LSIVKRGLLALLLFALVACGRPAARAFVFPQTVAMWRLKEVRGVAPADAPEQARKLGVKNAQTAQYEASGLLDVEIYELTSDAAALEMEQTWKPGADTVAFHGASYFAVVRWKNASREEVGAFVRQMQKQMGG